MNGMELAKCYWQQVGEPAFRAYCPEVLEHCAVGLVGEGSECFGYDDEISRDHDWGPGFCLWLTREDMERWGERARRIYQDLPMEFSGYRRHCSDPMSSGRVGVLEIGAFYARFLGIAYPPRTLAEWKHIPETGLAVATNGQIFFDHSNVFSEFREVLLNNYPEDLRRKKLAYHCALAAQSGQYNYERCRKRGDDVASLLALSQFIQHIQAIVFLLNRRYRPYYKWVHRAMKNLPILGSVLWKLIDSLVQDEDRKIRVEEICWLIIKEFEAQELSNSESNFLLDHARHIQKSIKDETLRKTHLMAE